MRAAAGRSGVAHFGSNGQSSAAQSVRIIESTEGDLPKPVKLGRAVRWRKSDILQWIEQGCPASDSLLNQLLYQVVWRPIYTLIGRL